MKSKLCSVVGAVGLLFATAFSAVHAQSPTAPITVARDDFKDWDKFAADFLSKDSPGSLPLATPIPAAARLHVHNRKLGPEGHPIACSGVLVGAREVVTAAHCVCGDSPSLRNWYYPAAKACSAALGDITAEVFFPTRGIFRAASITIHPDYIHPSAAPSDGAALGDLAILKLDRSPGLDPPEISAPSSRNRHVMAGFGVIALSAPIPGLPFLANTPYLEGLQMLSSNKRLRTGDSCGGRSNFKDIFCLRYDPFADAEGEERDFIVCRGDSGAPLFDIAAGGRISLVGIASFFDGGVSECQPEHAGVSFFESASYYAPWIQQHVSGAGPAAAPRQCHESFIDVPTNLKLKFAVDFLSVSTTAQDYNGAAFPAIELSGGASANECEILPDAGLERARLHLPLNPRSGYSAGSGVSW